MGAEPLIKRPQFEGGATGATAAGFARNSSGRGGGVGATALVAALPPAPVRGDGGCDGGGFRQIFVGPGRRRRGDGIGRGGFGVCALALVGAGFGAGAGTGGASARGGLTLTGRTLAILTWTAVASEDCGVRAATRPPKALETGFSGGLSLSRARATITRGCCGALQSRTPRRISSEPVSTL